MGGGQWGDALGTGKILILMGIGDLGSPSAVLHSTRTQFLLSIRTGMRKVAKEALLWQIRPIFIFHPSLQCHAMPKTRLISSQTHFPIPEPFGSHGAGGGPGHKR